MGKGFTNRSDDRTIRVFVSSTFRDMFEERDALMTHAWPALRQLCQERHVEFVEVDLRWGITESQSTRRETLKICLDEIHACRPFFIGLLGERYGWIPSDDAFTADLLEEQPWLADLRGRSATELEILHGVLNNPDMAGRAFFYFRDPAWARDHGPDFLSESASDADRQAALKSRIRTACETSSIPLREDYWDPEQLAAMVQDDLSAAIEAQFPREDVPEPLTREALDHEAFAEIRRRTYVGRPEYFEALNRHAAGDGGPLLVLGDSGRGKSALLANWLPQWRHQHPTDFIVQHHIGSTTDSADHWRLMTRVMAEVKRWSGLTEAVPTERDDVLKHFPLWLTEARALAAHRGVRFILVLDALNHLQDRDHARLLGWLPEHPFTGPLRLIASTLPRTAATEAQLEVIQKRHWQELCVEPLTVAERRQMITDYLARFGKTLGAHRVNRVASAVPAANPLYLKILLDDLRVTGTHDRLDERLAEYLKASDIPTLLQQVLARYQRDYERERPGMVGEALGLVYAARRGLSELELLQLLRAADQALLPPAHWAPLRAALGDALVDRGGILNFSHEHLRAAVEDAFGADADRRDALRLQLADYFEAQPISPRTCDELPWLLKETRSLARLRVCLLDIDRFVLIDTRDEDELRRYWVEQLQEQQTMGKAYLESFEPWAREPERKELRIAGAASRLGVFLQRAALHAEAEPLMRRAISVLESSLGSGHPHVVDQLSNLAALLQATDRFAEAEQLYRRGLDILDTSRGSRRPGVGTLLNNLAQLLKDTNRLAEAESLMRRALDIDEQSLGRDHPMIAIHVNNLASLLKDTNRLTEAESLMHRALDIDEGYFGRDHPTVAIRLNNLASLLEDTNRLAEAESLMRRALDILGQSFGGDHPDVARVLNNLGRLLQATNRFAEAEPLFRRVLHIWEQSFGEHHTDVATALSNLALLLQATNRLAEAEPLFLRALGILEQSFGRDHPRVAIAVNNLALLLEATNRIAEAEQLHRRALDIDEKSLGRDHPDVARDLNNLAALFCDTNRHAEAEPLMRRALDIFESSLGSWHPKVATQLNNLSVVLQATNRLAEAEPLVRRALEIDERSLGPGHPDVARDLSSLAQLLLYSNRFGEAEPLMRRALDIGEQSLGTDHPNVAVFLSNLAALLEATDRLVEAEPLVRRSLEIFIRFTRITGHPHPHLRAGTNHYAGLLQALGNSREEVMAALRRMDPELFGG